MSQTSAGGATHFTSNLTKDKVPDYVAGDGDTYDDGVSDIASSIYAGASASVLTASPKPVAARKNSGDVFRFGPSSPEETTDKADDDRSGASDETEKSPRKKPNGLDVSLTSSTLGEGGSGMPHIRRRGNRQRVPGGAAAKLVGKSNDEDSTYVEPTDQVYGEVKAPITELDEIRTKSKSEFSVGPSTNRRYHADEHKSSEHSAKELGESASETSTPSILNRSEAFHENATRAVMSLITPKQGMRGSGSAADATSIYSNKSFPEDTSTIGSGSVSVVGPLQFPTASAFQPPPREDVMSMTSATTTTTGIEHTFENNARSPIEKPLLTKRAEMVVEEMSKSMQDPSKTLSDLLSAIATPENGDLNRGFMVRRKNACGALQVLTAKKVHRVQLCWTVGVLPALTSVLEDTGDDGLESVLPNIHTRNEYIEARKRAVASLMNLSVPIENRLAIFHSPQLVPSLVMVINEDRGESRRGSCAVLAYLAKTVENRLLMVQVPGMLDALANVIKPLGISKKKKKRRHIVSTGTSDSETETGYGTGDSSSETTDSGSERNPLYTMSTHDASAGPETFASFLSDDKEEQNTLGTEVSMSYLSESVDRASARYDSDPSGFLRGARQNVFAILAHIVKEKDNAYHLSRHKVLTDTLVAVSKLHGSDFHVLAVKILANLTRHRSNSKLIVFKLRNVVPALVTASDSHDAEARKFACFGIQNLAQDKPCRQELAITPGLLSALCLRARKAIDPEERLSSIHALKNLTDEPANLIPMSNTPECFATLMQIAHASDESVTEMMQYLGCDALATLSHWFRSIATSGQRNNDPTKRQLPPSKELFVPTLKIATYETWQ